MAKLTLYPRAGAGTLASSSPGAEATTNTGWTVGTVAATNYKIMAIGEKRSASGWTSTPPTPNPTAGMDILESGVLSGKFAAENWAALLKVIAVTAGGDQDGAARVRLWRTKDKTTWTALTSNVDLSAVTNLAVGTAQATEGVLAPGGFTLTEEFLGLQLCWKITGAGAGSTRDVLFREGEGITLVTADFTPASGPPVTITAPPAIAVASAPVPTLKASITPPAAAAIASAPSPALQVAVSAPAASAVATAPAPALGVKLEPPTAVAVAKAPAPSTGTGFFVRRFDGAGDAIKCEVGHSDIATSDMSAAFLFRRAANGALHTLAALHSHSETVRHMIYLTASNKLGFRDSQGNDAGWTPFDWAGAGWVLAGVTKVAGSSVPHFYRYVFDTETLEHGDGDGPVGDAAGSSETLWLGGAKEFGSFNGEMAAAAFAKAEMSLAVFEGLVGAVDLTHWLNRSPSGLWLLKQSSTEDLVIDYTYNGADAPAAGIVGTLVIGEDPPIPYGTPPLPPSEFRGDFETGDLSQFEAKQALDERITVVSKVSPISPVAQGRYAARFEVQEGDVEPATGSQRAELVSGRRFYGGERLHFRDRFRVDSFDPAHFTIIWQIHDAGGGSPPLALQVVGTEKEPRLQLVPFGKNKESYWEAPFELGRFYESIIRPEFGPDGSVEVWLDRVQQTLDGGLTIIEGIDTLGVPMSYDKLGIYRGTEATDETVVYHDDYWVGIGFPPLPTVSRVAVTREFPPDRLAVRVADPTTGQTVARWAQDEPNAENVVADLRKNGEMPGGHKEMTCSLARDPRVDYPDLATYNDVYVEQPGGEIVWEGRLDKKPKSDGERLLIEPAAVGHQAALQDRKGIIGPGFIDPDLSKWGEIPAQRRANLQGEGVDLNGFTSLVEPAGGGDDNASEPAGISFTSSALKAEVQERGELVYFGGGVDIGKVLYDFKGRPPGEEDADFLNRIDLSADGISTTVAGTDHNTETAFNQVVEDADPAEHPLAKLKYAIMTSLYGGPAEIDPFCEAFRFQRVLVLGTHGLPLQGTWPNVGFTSGQMLRYAIPLYTYLEATEESVEDKGYVILRAWFSDPGMMALVVQEVTKYELLDWFVLHGKLFEQRIPGTYGRRWQAYVGASELKQTGEDGSRLWDRIMVRYTDVDGSTRTVGYPGSGAMVESAALQITDPDHPAVKAGKVREDLLDLQGISTAARAEEAGERWLADANELPRSGEVTLRGYVMDDKGIERPVAQVQPGDWFRPLGASDDSYRKIVLPDCDDPTKTCQVTLDAPSESLQSLLERMQAALIPLGLS